MMSYEGQRFSKHVIVFILLAAVEEIKREVKKKLIAVLSIRWSRRSWNEDICIMYQNCGWIVIFFVKKNGRNGTSIIICHMTSGKFQKMRYWEIVEETSDLNFDTITCHKNLWIHGNFEGLGGWVEGVPRLERNRVYHWVCSALYWRKQHVKTVAGQRLRQPSCSWWENFIIVSSEDH